MVARPAGAHRRDGSYRSVSGPVICVNSLTNLPCLDTVEIRCARLGMGPIASAIRWPAGRQLKDIPMLNRVENFSESRAWFSVAPAVYRRRLSRSAWRAKAMPSR